MTGVSTSWPPLSGAWEIQAPLAVSAVSRTWRVQAGERLAVLRLDESGARRLGLNREAEPGVLGTAAAAGVGPACLHADPARGLLLTEWLPGQAWTAALLRQPANLRQAGELLRRVHALHPAGPLVDLGTAIDRYAGAAGPAGTALAATARERLAAAIGSRFDPLAGRLCLCHNDPTPGNFIAAPDGQLRLIDWEYAGLCHPGFDLGGLAEGAGLTGGEAAGVLLEAYLGHPPTAGETGWLRAWQELCQVLGQLWTAALIGGR